MPARRDLSASSGAGVRKPPRKEPAGAGGRVWRLWGFDRAAVSARDGRAGVAEGGLPSIIENWSPLLHSTVGFSTDRRHRIGVRGHRRDSGVAPGAACSGGRRMKPGSDGGHDMAVRTPASGDGGPRGVPPRSKVSTMVMRPPQQGHDSRCSATVSVAPASSCCTGVSVDGIGAASNSLARAILTLQAAVASSP